VIEPIRGGIYCLAVLLSVLFASPGFCETTIIRGFTLIDGTGKAPVANAALVMTDGRIAWVGANSAAPVLAGATSIDYRGKFVMPGIFDSHVHVGNMHGQVQDSRFFTKENVELALKQFAAYGVTSVFSAGTEKDEIFPMRLAQRQGRPAEARIFAAGEGLFLKGGYGGVAGFNRPVSTPEDAIALVDEDAAKGVDVIKFWIDDEEGTRPVKMSHSITSAIINEAHAKGLKVVGHVYYYEDARALIDQGVDGFMHMVRDRPLDAALLDSMKQHGTWQLAATMSREASFALRPLPFLADPFFVKGIPVDELAYLRDPALAKEQHASPLFKYYGPNFQMAKDNMARIAKAGIPFAMGTDSGPVGRFPGYNAHLEMAYLVEIGVKPMDAIIAATAMPAKFFGASDLGTLEPGKQADLLVLDANPLSDIRNTRTIRAVYISGREVANVNQAKR
jgi:imidazolonepropionase-like amidohydrolase